MDQQLSRSEWSRLKAMIKQDLAGVTEDDLAACGGRRDKLIEKLQEIYGISPDEAEGAVMHYEQRLMMWYSRARSQALN
jgi:uncharacterized protein YjbJ (UPF0337 family)